MFITNARETYLSLFLEVKSQVNLMTSVGGFLQYKELEDQVASG